MSSNSETQETPLSVEALQRIDCICLEYEAAWKRGEPPRLEQYLGDAHGAEA